MTPLTPPGPPMEEPEPEHAGTGYLPPLPGPPYPPGNPYASPARPGRVASFDGISLAALICSLTCCAGVVGIGLGIAGVVRTSKGRRRGRWAAVLGIVVGVLGTAVVAAALVGIGWLGVHGRDASSLATGDCVNFLTDDLDSLLSADCDGPHDAEVVYQARFTETLVDRYRSEDASAFCGPYADRVVKRSVAGPKSDYYLGVTVTGTDLSDDFACLIWRIDGKQLEEDLVW